MVASTFTRRMSFLMRTNFDLFWVSWGRAWLLAQGPVEKGECIQLIDIVRCPHDKMCLDIVCKDIEFKLCANRVLSCPSVQSLTGLDNNCAISASKMSFCVCNVDSWPEVFLCLSVQLWTGP